MSHFPDDDLELGRQLASLDRLLELYAELDEAVADHLQQWPDTPSLAHTRNGYFALAVGKAKDKAIKHAERSAVLAEQRAANAELREYTEHERTLAKVMGITPAEFREKQAAAAAKMRRPQTQAELDEVMRNAR